MYQQLLVLREGLYQTIDLSCSTSAGAAGAQVSNGTAASSEEVKALKEENAKLKYRVKFLVKTIDEVESKKK